MSEESFATGTDDNQGQQAAQQTTQQAFTLKVGDRTFTSEEDASKHITHSQQHIAKLEQENEALRKAREEDAAKLGEMDELKDQVNSLVQEVRGIKPAESEPSQTGAVDTSKLVEQVKASIHEETAQERRSNNWEKAKSAAVKKWGEESYIEKITERANALGLNIADVDKLAKDKPQAFQRIILEDSGANSGTRRDAVADTSANFVPEGGQQQQTKPQTAFHKMSTKDRAAEVERRIAEKEKTRR